MIEELSSSSLVSDLLDHHPQLVLIFLEHGMACVGCSMARFETLESAAQVYGLDAQGLLRQFQEAISNQERIHVGGSMTEHETPCCLACEQTSQQTPLLAILYQGQQYWICPQHLPVLIHKPHELVGRLPGADKLSGYES